MSSGKPVDNLSWGVGGINLGPSENATWETAKRKQKGKSGTVWGQQTSAPRAWGQPDTAHRLGMHSCNTPVNARNSPQGGGGQNWAARTGSSQGLNERVVENIEDKLIEEDEDDDDLLTDDDDDDDDDLSDDYDSDDGPQSHETRKKHKLLKGFFSILDQLTVPEINDPMRQWHCPACQGGPGAIDWYKGIQPLMAHARTKGSVRVKLHRDFANLFDEELRRRGTSAIPAGEAFGHWEGLKQEIKDHEIVWPPMVVVMNTQLEKEEDKWTGMGNQELLDYFRGYAALKARHSYGPQGHRGLSLLIFESTVVGYQEAERLHKHFLDQGTARAAWERKGRPLFYQGGKRQLYGFLARAEDLDEFNRHCQGKTKLRYEKRSYHEMVVIPMKQMNEDNQQLSYFKNKVVKEQRNAKALEESLTIVSQRLRMTMEENKLVRLRTREQHEQNKKEMDAQEQFFGDQIKTIHESTKEKEDNFEKEQQELRRKKVESLNENAASNDGDHTRSREFIKYQDQEMEKFATEREELEEINEKKKIEMKKRHWEEEVELEKNFEDNLTRLMEKYKQASAHVANTTNA